MTNQGIDSAPLTLRLLIDLHHPSWKTHGKPHLLRHERTGQTFKSTFIGTVYASNSRTIVLPLGT